MDNYIDIIDRRIKKVINKVSTRRLAFFLLIGLFVVFIAITAIILIHSPEEFEASFSRRIQEFRHPVVDFYMKAVSFLGERHVVVPMIIVTAAGFALFGYSREALFVLFTSLASVVNYFLKWLINRPRPAAELIEILTEVRHQSFPSGHTVHFVVFFGFVLVVVFRMHPIRAWVRLLVMLICLVLILSIPFSRVYLGAHWVSDVTAGFIVGILLLAVLLHLYLRPLKER